MSWLSAKLKKAKKKLKKLKLKDVMGSDIVEGALSFVPGGSMVSKVFDVGDKITEFSSKPKKEKTIKEALSILTEDELVEDEPLISQPVRPVGSHIHFQSAQSGGVSGAVFGSGSTKNPTKKTSKPQAR